MKKALVLMIDMRLNSKKPKIEEIINKADNIVQFGWKKEAIPVTVSKKSFVTRIFQEIFQ